MRLVTTPNQGVSRARNLGTRLASGQFFQYLDADDVLAEGKIRAQMAVLEGIGGEVAYGDWQKMQSVGGKWVPDEIIARAIEDEADLVLFGDFWCPPAAYLFRRTIVEIGRASCRERVYVLV